MKMFIFPLLLLGSYALLIAFRPALLLFRKDAFQKTMDRVAEVHSTQESLYHGYSWQEIEALVDKILAEHSKAKRINDINHALETGEYGNYKKFFAYDSLTDREQNFLNLLFTDASPNENPMINELRWVQRIIFCGLLEAATADALNMLTNEAIVLRDECQVKFGLRWYPLVVARQQDIEITDDHKLEQLSTVDSKLYLFWYLFFNEFFELTEKMKTLS